MHSSVATDLNPSLRIRTLKSRRFQSYIAALVVTLFSFTAQAQSIQLRGQVNEAATGQPLPGVEVLLQGTGHRTFTDGQGMYRLTDLPSGTYTVVAFYVGLQSASQELELTSGTYTLDFSLHELGQTLDEVEVAGVRESFAGMRRLEAVEGAAIYEAKKNEVIEVQALTANLATNNSRQLYAKVPGLNIWESDGAGLQLGIGARGLDPNRTSNFNVRQNGYDISADALGYPESYYTPPAEAIERIEVVRGAASLQYGTQFGGLLNFVLRQGPDDRKLQVTTRQTGGSFGLFNSFNSVGGTVGKVNYYGFYQHKRRDGWRPNEGFTLDMAYGSVVYQATDRLSLTGQYTYMHYLAQQPGGLTDALYAQNPRQSIRSRNWFQVNWNLAALLLDYRITDRLKLNVRNFALLGGRDALGNLNRIDRVDDGSERNLFVDDFRNFGNETRLLYHYKLGAQPAVGLLGFRYYQGFTHRMQGNGDRGDGPTFQFLQPDNLENSDFDFPSQNVALFTEHVFNLTPHLSVTPGLRFEHIRTQSDGYYQDRVLVANPETGLAEDSTFQVPEQRDRRRSFVFAGLGVSFKQTPLLEWYGNFSQNYRAINFNDIRVVNPNQTVDPDIQDETGYNFDLGIRGTKNELFNYDVSLFYLRYNGRIGSILRTDDATYRIYRYRTNVADSRHIGLESFAELNLLKLLRPATAHRLNLFANLSFIDARYIATDEPSIKNRQVELVPPLNFKTGLSFQRGHFKAAYQLSYTAQQYSDATNARFTPSAVEGVIPAYSVMDLSASYRYRWVTLEGSLNNLLDRHYFTRRAAGYPGPGIIPSDGRSCYVTLQVQF
ncbi:Fe(3+) dicitrate transport protein [Catalinimonas alkaloidigena]|uniref:Fe(3+) dicitrate transport protein n=1 Tax=Catalinimonas alkaloidigena TaxID=1075417 RepID=A0A1G9JIF4_9BACT|nr:TonB-dependent receptor [Catalinimonas alkaloidigena]SDL37016.1 Fe(3+) dicitrate transport protein [Catalinimonas alkaloidigena]